MPEFGFSHQVTGVTEVIRSMRENSQRLSGSQMRSRLRACALFAQRTAVQRLEERPEEWHPQRGILARSIGIRDIDDNTVRTGTGLVYARIQQEGGTITPKTVNYLAIPATKQLARSGKWPRDFAKGELRKVVTDISIGNHSWRGLALVANTKTDQKRRTLAKKRKQGGKSPRKTKTVNADGYRVLYALIRSAKITGRPYLVYGTAESEAVHRIMSG